MIYSDASLCFYPYFFSWCYNTGMNFNLPSPSKKWGHHFLRYLWPSTSFNSFAGPSYRQFWYLPRASLLHWPYHIQWYSCALAHCNKYKQIKHCSKKWTSYKWKKIKSSEIHFQQLQNLGTLVFLYRLAAIKDVTSLNDIL